MAEATTQRRCDGCAHWQQMFVEAPDGDGYLPTENGTCRRFMREGPSDRARNRHLFRQVTLADDTCRDWVRNPDGEHTDDAA